MKTQKTLEQILNINDSKVRSKELVALADSYIQSYIDKGLMLLDDLDMYIDSVLSVFERRFGNHPFINVSNEMKGLDWLCDNFFKIFFFEDIEKELMHNQTFFRQLVICVENGLDIYSNDVTYKMPAISYSKELILGINPFEEPQKENENDSGDCIGAESHHYHFGNADNLSFGSSI